MRNKGDIVENLIKKVDVKTVKFADEGSQTAELERGSAETQTEEVKTDIAETQTEEAVFVTANTADDSSMPDVLHGIEKTDFANMSESRIKNRLTKLSKAELQRILDNREKYTNFTKKQLVDIIHLSLV